MLKYIYALVVAVVAVFTGVLFSIDLDSPGAGGDVGPKLGSGAMFDAIADRYDVTNKVISLGSDVSWRKELVSSLGLRAGDKVLDLATGTADVAIMLAREKERPHVTGVDPSNNMLSHGRLKVAASDLSGRVELFQGDAQNLGEYGSKSFDKACISFGIRNVPDRVAALKEMARVTQSGGAVAVLEFSEPWEGFLAPAARFFVNNVVPRLGALLSGAREEYVHLQNSIKEFPLPAAFRDEMASAGLLGVESRMVHPGGVYLYTSRAP